MSRKREKQRESRRELAKQLDGAGDVDADTLRAHARSSEPEWKAALVVEKRRLHLLPRKTTLDVALFVVDGAGARFVMRERFDVGGGKGAALTSVARAGVDKLRYTRPGTFVIVAALDLPDASAAHLEDPARLGVAGLAKERTSAGALTVLDVDGAALAIPAPHRVEGDVELPLAGAELTGKLRLHVRL